jgi:hypothetical protein
MRQAAADPADVADTVMNQKVAGLEKVLVFFRITLSSR